MSTWTIVDGDDNTITSGLSGPEVSDEIYIVGSRLANERGEPLWAAPQGGDYSDAIRFDPDDED